MPLDGGIKCTGECVEEIRKLTGTKKIYRYLIFKISDDMDKVVVDKIGEREKTFKDMKEELSPHEPRYVAFDMDYFTARENQPRSGIIMFLFIPTSMPGIETKIARKLKMIYPTAEEALKSKLGDPKWHKKGVYDDYGEISEQDIIEELRQKSR